MFVILDKNETKNASQACNLCFRVVCLGLAMTRKAMTVNYIESGLLKINLLQKAALFQMMLSPLSYLRT